MASFSYPGVFTIERDNSAYTPGVDSSVVGVVGFASKGPVNKPTLVTSQQNLVNIFGKGGNGLPGQAIESLVEILETTNTAYFVRGVTTSALNASASVQIGACPAVIVSSNGYGVSANLYLNIQVTNNAGVSQFLSPKQIDIPSGTVSSTYNQGQAIVKQVGNGLDQSVYGAVYDANSITSGYIFGAFAGSAATVTVTAYSNSTRTTGVSALLAIDQNGLPTGAITSSVTASGVTVNSGAASGFSYFVQSLYPGAGYNLGTATNGSVSGNSVEISNLGFVNTLLTVNEDGKTKENFKVNFQASTGFVEDTINTGLTNLKSDTVRGYLVSCLQDIAPTKLTSFTQQISDMGLASITGKQGSTAVGSVNPRFLKFVQGSYGLAAGTNGVSTDNDTNALALIGDQTLTPKTGIYALDDDSLNISMAVVPGFNNQSLQNALITLAESSQNFLAIVSPPYGTIDSVQEAVDWSNGQSDTRTAAINSSWAALYWPWLQVFSPHDLVDKWYDPVTFAARQMCFTDATAEAWFAPAGFTRGRLTKPTAVDVILNEGDRSTLGSGGNVINPIVKFPQDGITIFGQRTCQRVPSALDRVNVRRLMIILRKSILAGNRKFVFDPNDPITWEAIKVNAEALLEDVRRRRGITDYKVVCDESINTPARIDNSQVWCKVILIPTKAAEAIVFELNVTANTVQIGG